MQKISLRIVVAAVLSALVLIPTGASAGCVRWGETGYHYYRSCVGPSFMYPHRGHCYRDGVCVYH